MSPTWPNTLPEWPVNNRFSIDPQELTVRSSMDTGPAKVRRRFTAAVYTIKAQYILTSDQWATLLTFYEDYPSTAFTYKRPDTGDNVDARFVKAPSVSVDANSYRVTVELEVLP